MEGYEPGTYGDRLADVYDGWYSDVTDAEATVERVTALAGDPPGPVLELGAGSGRLALPLAARGLEVWALDASAAMVERLQAARAGHAEAVFASPRAIGAGCGREGYCRGEPRHDHDSASPRGLRCRGVLTRFSR